MTERRLEDPLEASQGSSVTVPSLHRDGSMLSDVLEEFPPNILQFHLSFPVRYISILIYIFPTLNTSSVVHKITFHTTDSKHLGKYLKDNLLPEQSCSTFV